MRRFLDGFWLMWLIIALPITFVGTIHAIWITMGWDYAALFIIPTFVWWKNAAYGTAKQLILSDSSKTEAA